MSLKLIISWVSDRSACVVFGMSKSKIFYVYVGLPQGSSLSPYLFIVYHNGLVTCISAHACHIFADDLNVLMTPPICRKMRPMIEFLEMEGMRVYNKMAIYSKK